MPVTPRWSSNCSPTPFWASLCLKLWVFSVSWWPFCFCSLFKYVSCRKIKQSLEAYKTICFKFNPSFPDFLSNYKTFFSWNQSSISRVIPDSNDNSKRQIRIFNFVVKKKGVERKPRFFMTSFFNLGNYPERLYLITFKLIFVKNSHNYRSLLFFVVWKKCIVIRLKYVSLWLVGTFFIRVSMTLFLGYGTVKGTVSIWRPSWYVSTWLPTLFVLFKNYLTKSLSLTNPLIWQRLKFFMTQLNRWIMFL